MKRLSLLKANLRCRWAVFFIVLLWAGALAHAIPDQAQSSVKPDAARPPQDETQAPPTASKKKLYQGGVWHHFGESDHASAAGQSQAGAWHHFGQDLGSSKVSPEATAPQPSFDADRMAGLEKKMWALINQDRSNPVTSAETGGRARPLKWNESLAAVAREHSRNMLEQQFFAHVEPGGKTLAMRIDQAAIPWQTAGENIAIHQTIFGAEAAFMNEPRFQLNHRGNILNTGFTDVGIGIVQGPDGSLYITQDFVESPPDRDAARKGSMPSKENAGIVRPQETGAPE
jgi:uncharacterized protein YkwD